MSTSVEHKPNAKDITFDDLLRGFSAFSPTGRALGGVEGAVFYNQQFQFNALGVPVQWRPADRLGETHNNVPGRSESKLVHSNVNDNHGRLSEHKHQTN